MKNSKKTITTFISLLLICTLIILSILYIDKRVNPKVTDKTAETSQEEYTGVLTLEQAKEAISYNTDNSTNTQSNDSSANSQATEATDTTNINYLPVSQSAWLPSWANSQGLDAISQEYVDLEYVMPVWYGVNKDGTLVDRKPSGYQQLSSLAQTKNFKIVPSIAMFDAPLFSEILSGQSLQTHVNSIVDEVNSNNYAGIDLDYEAINLADKANFEEFIKLLSSELHKTNKILSVTVLSQWGDDIIYTGLRETRQVQDWEFLNTYVDQIRIMSYDYTSSSATIAGPIGPINWQYQILEYAVSKIDRSKIWLGVHLYGYVWNESGFVKSTVAQDIPAILETANTQQHSEILEEGYAEYPCGTQTCTIYYQDDLGVEARYRLAQEFGIAGVAYWRLGQNESLLNIQNPL